MHRAKNLAQELIQEAEIKLRPRISKIELRFPEKGMGEGFRTACESGVLHVDAESPLAAAYAASQLTPAVVSGHLPEFLGQMQPCYPLRPIWVGSGPEMVADGSVGFALPRFLCDVVNASGQQEGWELFCRRVIELGYNAVVLGLQQQGSGIARQTDFTLLSDFCFFLREFGIKPIVKCTLNAKNLSRCPLHPDFQDIVISGMQTLLSAVPETAFIFWESGLQHPSYTQHPSARDIPLPELAAAEIRVLERSLSPATSLIYFVPAADQITAKQQASWLNFLCDEAGKGTVISFPAVAGNVVDDHLPAHPYWQELRHCPDVSSTPLLPIINAGSLMQGECLWPAPTFDILEKYCGRLLRHRFAGAAVLCNLLPREGSMLDCSLWTTSQALWRNLPPMQLAETWFCAYRPDWSFADIVDALRSLRQLVVDLSYLRSLTCNEKKEHISSEDCRIMTDGVLARLKDLKMRAEKLERRQNKRGEHPSFSDYLEVFQRDAQRVVLHFLQYFHLSYPLSMSESDLEDSFWLQLSPGASQGIRSSAKVEIFDEPRRGKSGSRMEAIFVENRLI